MPPAPRLPRWPSSRDPRRIRLRVVRVQSHDRALALRAIKARIAAGDPPVIFFELHKCGNVEPPAKRRLIERARDGIPSPARPAVWAWHPAAESNAGVKNRLLDRLKVRAGFQWV